jgi:lysyl-tRNA synthetase class 2
MSPLVAGLTDAYRDGIVETGREAQFLFFVAFLLTFAFIRTSTHMIRAQVSWWPGNVSVGGTHIHHLVWGILLLLIFGWIGIAVAPDSPWREIAAVMFGVGTGLTLDEFALWLNLKDVYWSKEGRRSIDAVVIALAISGMVLVGLRGWIDAADKVETYVFAVVGSAGVLGILLALVNAAKEKFGMALLGFMVPLVHIIGAVRLGKPNSVWAKLFYKRGRKRASKARFKGPRGEPFWKRGPELLSRLRLRSAPPARSTRSRGTTRSRRTGRRA